MKVYLVWKNFWFSPCSPMNLALGRFVFCFGLFLIMSDRLPGTQLQLWATIPASFWKPISFFTFLNGPIQSEFFLKMTGVLFFVTLVLTGLGLFTRLSSWFCFLSALFYLGYGNNFGKIHHSQHLAVVCLGILAFSRCGDWFSIDSFLKKKHRLVDHVSSAEYRWPVQLLRVSLVLVYFAAGFQKAKISGLEWVFSDNLKDTLLAWGHPPGVFFASHFPFLCQVGAGLTFFGELFAPAAFINRKFASVLIPNLLGFHLMARVLMGTAVAFAPMQMAFVFWIPFEFLWKFALKKFSMRTTRLSSLK